MSTLSMPYLATTPRLLKAQAAMNRLEIPQLLSPFRPTLVGTIPLGIDLPQSDIDIICEVKNFENFSKVLKTHYEDRDHFSVAEKNLGGKATVCRFQFDNFAFEIVGQDKKIERNRAYLHMIAEARLLLLMDKNQIELIKELRKGGMKTEPAFCELLGIQSDPYHVLAKLAKAPDDELKKLVLLNKSLIADHPAFQ